MSESIESVRQEIATTRARLGETVAAIDATVHARVEGARDTIYPTRVAQRYPWYALAGAIGAGFAVAMTGADRKAAAATVEGAKRAGPATVSALKRAKDAAGERLHREKGNAAGDYGLGAVAPVEEPGFLGRLLAPVRDLVDQRAAELVEVLWDASRDFNPQAPATPPAFADAARVHSATRSTSGAEATPPA